NTLRVPLSLHSFPTRRSSDLPFSSARASTASGSQSSSAPSPATAGSEWLPPTSPDTRLVGRNKRERPVRATASPPSSPTPSASRSEEHTSELQSPCNLVCRLL